MSSVELKSKQAPREDDGNKAPLNPPRVGDEGKPLVPLVVLATYQHTLWGAGSELTTVQPIAFYNNQRRIVFVFASHHDFRHKRPHDDYPRWIPAAAR